MYSQQLVGSTLSAAGARLAHKLNQQSVPKGVSRAAQQRARVVHVAARKVQVTGVTVKSAQEQKKALRSSSSSSSVILGAFNTLYSPLNGLVGTPLYTALQLVVLVLTLGVVDAGYSGDWSRIGVISKETELLLQQLVLVVVGVHAACGAAAAAVAKQSGGGWVVPAVKGFLFGSLAVYELTAPTAANTD